MAGDIFLKLDGIPGDSKDDKHKNEIEILSWHWGMTQSGTGHFGPGSGGGKVSASDLTIQKRADKASNALMKYCANGKPIASGLLTMRKAGGDAQVEYLKVKLEQIVVSSYQMAGQSGELDQFHESLSLNFAKYVATFTEQTDQGTAGASSDNGWDFAANKTNS
jgi:type VI secretion system secreted protein Hcp